MMIINTIKEEESERKTEREEKIKLSLKKVNRN